MRGEKSTQGREPAGEANRISSLFPEKAPVLEAPRLAVFGSSVIRPMNFSASPVCKDFDKQCRAELRRAARWIAQTLMSNTVPPPPPNSADAHR